MITDRGKCQFECHGLTTQAKTIDLAVQGFLHKSIAHELDISVRTVEQHLSTAAARLNVPNRTVLLTATVQWGWVNCEHNGGVEPEAG